MGQVEDVNFEMNDLAKKLVFTPELITMQLREKFIFKNLIWNLCLNLYILNFVSSSPLKALERSKIVVATQEVVNLDQYEKSNATIDYPSAPSKTSEIQSENR